MWTLYFFIILEMRFLTDFELQFLFQYHNPPRYRFLNNQNKQYIQYLFGVDHTMIQPHVYF